MSDDQPRTGDAWVRLADVIACIEAIAEEEPPYAASPDWYGGIHYVAHELGLRFLRA